jgi:tRNA threonylcarbamoyladenosine biosynthesis protein TsaE
MNKGDFINKIFVTDNSDQTQKLGRDFAKVLEKGDIICLYGELGSGKTTFVQGLAKGLGISSRIISPTFIIMRSHKLKLGMFYHIDLYRIESEKNIESLGFKEVINDQRNIIAIEWAEKLGSLSPQKRIDIKFFHKDNHVREILFRSLNQ